MVLLAGQYEAGLLVCASGQFAGSVLRVGGFAGLKILPNSSIRFDNSCLVISDWPLSTVPSGSTCSDCGRPSRRFSIPFMSIFAHASAPLSKPIWNAPTRSRADPWGFLVVGFSAVGVGSRSSIAPARTWSRPSVVLRVKRGERPSATHRTYVPEKQSACCSRTRTGVELSTTLAILWMACPYSCASTAFTDIGPKYFLAEGKRTRRP